VRVRRKVVDARYLETSVPATHTPSFEAGMKSALDRLFASTGQAITNLSTFLPQARRASAASRHRTALQVIR
jgi:hypothetical protein